jgi:tetratricopeptide (TPR) repeat protein
MTQYSETNNTSQDKSFADRLNKALVEYTSNINSGGIHEAFSIILKFFEIERSVILDMVNSDKLSSSSSLESDDSDESLFDLCALYDILGTVHHLKCNFNMAVDSYQTAIKLNKNNLDPNLKLAAIYLELGELENARKIYDMLCESQMGLNLAWSLIHRSSLWITKNEKGDFIENAINLANSDIDKALELTGKYFCLVYIFHINICDERWHVLFLNI